MTIDQPYFMENPEWFYHDEKEFRYKLTDKAPEEAVRSYEEFYSSLEFYRRIEPDSEN